MRNLHRSQPVARKNHFCSYCGTLIPKGEQYYFETNVYEGQIYNWKSHKDCSHLVDHLNMQDICDEGVTADDFCEIVDDAYEGIMTEDNVLSLADFKEKLSFMIHRMKEEIEQERRDKQENYG